jgi:hypothetical protein
VPPSAPAADDPAFGVTLRRWLMAGDGLTPRDETLEVAVTAPDGVRVVDLWIDGDSATRLTRRQDGAFAASLPAPLLGRHQVVLSADGKDPAFAVREVVVSHALYTVVSTDWDDSDNPDDNLGRMEMLRARHPRLLMTQFFGPYVLTDPDVMPARRDHNLAWVKQQHDQFGDEIGVHIHPRCSWVGTTSVPCRQLPSTVYPMGDDSGYTVIFAAYSQDEQTQLLGDAADLFEAHGLPRPVSFRAGGWTADLGTVAACARAGYTIESSAFPPQSIQTAWMGYELARWTMEHWMGITPTSQPYYPSMSDVLHGSPAPDFPVLEVPDNGTLADYMESSDMLGVLDMNWPGRDGPLGAPAVFQIGFHPPSFFAAYYQRMDEALAEVDRHLVADDAGPIRYVVLADLLRVGVWSSPTR